jgi:hypothetical protein
LAEVDLIVDAATVAAALTATPLASAETIKH